MHTTYRMMESGMVRTWIDQITQSHLSDASQSLKVWMFYQFKYLVARHRNKSIDRIV